MNIKFYDSKKDNELDAFIDVRTSGSVVVELIFSCLKEDIYSSDERIFDLIKSVLREELLDLDIHACRCGFNSVKVEFLR